MSKVELHHGDSAEVLKELDDCSVDSIVTDPPYGLSAPQGSADRIYGILRKVGLPDLMDMNAKPGQGGAFLGVSLGGSALAGVDGAIREKSGVGVPESAVDLKGVSAVEHEVGKAAELPSAGVADGSLPSEPNAEKSQDLGDFVLDIGDLPAATIGDLSSRSEPELFSGGFAVPISAVFPSGHPGFAAGGAVIDFGSDVVRLANGAARDAGGPSSVVALPRAVNAIMLRFDLSGRPAELCATSRADERATIGHSGCAQLVRASAAASGLPSVAEPHRVRFVGGSTDGADSFHLRIWLPRQSKINARIPRGGFMGKDWDSMVPSVDLWAECLRVLKPGGHLLAFGGSRTYHRLAVAVEDAGFEIRDQIMWVYGSGFPKSQNVSKAIDKAAGARGHDSVGFNVAGKSSGLGTIQRPELRSDHPDYIKPQGTTPAAKQWQGFGTALKPAHEPIVMARKPLSGTVAATVMEWGTGALNIDGCRVHAADVSTERKRHGGGLAGNGSSYELPDSKNTQPPGRWPANVIHDGSDEVVGLFPVTTSGGGDKHGRKASSFCASTDWQAFKGTSIGGDTGSAARFFYSAKASKKDRGEGNTHPTVKPTDLMAYLCRLVTPPGGTVLDPFMGSGSTGKAAVAEGFGFVGIEREAEYIEIARARIDLSIQQQSEHSECAEASLDLFTEEET